eukprot:m.423152 g.423152  ORF g.423152 m.423152 type:complete len:72 (+) comp20207_c2_seq1:718-933(+)
MSARCRPLLFSDQDMCWLMQVAQLVCSPPEPTEKNELAGATRRDGFDGSTQVQFLQCGGTPERLAPFGDTC